MTIIRPFTPADYEPVLAISNAAWPEYPETVEEWRTWDAHRSSRCRWARYVLEEAGQITAYADYNQNADNYHPRQFEIGVTVHPDHRERGLGSRLYEHLLAELAPFQPLCVRAHAREDRSEALRFLARREFREEQRERESRLPLQGFDFARFAGARERVSEQGIGIRTLRELQADPEWEHKLYDLVTDVDRDVPHPEPATKVEFEDWKKRFHGSPNRLLDGYFLAVHDGRYVGVSYVSQPQAADYLDTGLTGVRREYRRRGIALALKLAVVEFGVRNGSPEIRTWNDRTNAGMIGINDQLGFQPIPAWIMFRKDLASE